MFAVRWLKPHVIHVVWPDVVSEPELQRFVERHDGLLAAHPAAYVALHEAVSVPLLGAKQRAFLAKWVGENADKNHVFCRGVAFVTSSSLVRGIITAVSWMHTHPYPSKTFSEREAALAWLQELLVRRAAHE
jgi:hypothetical protein